MSFDAEAQIAREIMKFAVTDQLYRGSKPVMWSSVEKTALAEAEVEYHEKTSPTIWVKFKITNTLDGDLDGASVVIWTTTPWTIPANRAIAYGENIAYGLYEVTEAADDNWAKVGDRFVIADKLAADVFAAARVAGYERVKDVLPVMIERCAHPFRGLEGANGYWDFAVPVLPADYVTDDAGTGFVHTAPGHGADDYNTLREAQGRVRGLRHEGSAAHGVAGFVLLPRRAVLRGRAHLRRQGQGCGRQRGGDQEARRGRRAHRARAPEAPVSAFLALEGAAHLPQHAAMVHRHGQAARRQGRHAASARAPCASRPSSGCRRSGENRITGMIENRPDWVVSRQRAWGVPIAVFVKKGTNEILKDERVNDAIADAFEKEGADAWYADDGSRFLKAGGYDLADFDKINDILDVWFDSGCTHAFALEKREDLKVTRKVDGGPDQVMYLEGSDQHRGWFHSSLLESCGTRGRAPYDIVLTHGFVLDEKGQKMSKSLGNVVAPQKVIQDSGADILRLWVAASDYSDDLRIGPEILKTFVETYRKLRNTIRWMLGSLAHFREADKVAVSEMPELERFVLHRLAELDGEMREAYSSLRLQAGDRAPQLVHDHGPVGVLFRHPQGRALLRSDLEQGAQERAHGDRPDLPLRGDLDRADPRLHGGGGLARALSGRRVGASRNLPASAGGMARRGAGRALGEGAPRAPCRHRRAGDRACAEAHRREPRGRAGGAHRRREPAQGRRRVSTSPRSASRPASGWCRARARPRPSVSTT